MKQITTPDTRATHEDSRADSKTVWTVTEDEELFKKDTMAVEQVVLPDAVGPSSTQSLQSQQQWEDWLCGGLA